MKRIIVLALAACMVLGAALGASATEFKASGNLEMGYNFVSIDNHTSATGEATDTNKFNQRYRAQIEMIASENLSGVVYFEITQDWGHEGDLGKVGQNAGGDLGADGVNIKTRRVYVDFLVPSTSINLRAGIQGLALPSAVAGSPVLDEDVAAIVASSSFEGVNLTGFFARPYDTDDSETTADLFGAIASAELGGATVSPYAMFAYTGKDAEYNNDTQWYGVAVTFAPVSDFTFSFDGVYGKASDSDGGFVVTGKAAYAADFATPALVAWYATGNDDDGEGQMPSLDETGMAPTTLVGAGAWGCTEDAVFGSALGKWGVSLQAEEISFIEKLSHTVRLTYIQGTNDDSAASLSDWDEDDHAFEFDVVNVYNVYENLDFVVDLAYAVTDFDSDATDNVDNVFKAAATVKYNF